MDRSIEAGASSTPIREESREGILPRRLVVKCGTRNLCNPDTGRLDQKIFNGYARQIVELQKLGVQIIIVSSGAIQAGKEVLIGFEKDEANYTKSQIASLGQSVLMEKWGESFKEYKKAVGQVMVTYANWEDQGERESITKVIVGLIEKGEVPILNENDPVSDKEIVLMERRISENDKLARMVAFLVEADAVLFLTDEGGVYASDPKIDPSVQLYKEINVDDMPVNVCVSSENNLNGGTGGMVKKLEAASDCARKGLRVAISSGKEEDEIVNFASGRPIGTRIGTRNQLG